MHCSPRSPRSTRTRVIDLCDAAVEAAVLQTTDDPDRYTFAHALIEHTLYDGLSPARRSRAHKAVAEQLETLAGPDGGSRVGELAYHWAQAVQPADTAKAIHYAQAAGDRARDQLAPDDAIRWYAQALELIDRAPEPDRRQRVEILIGLGDAERQSGVAAHREHLLEAAEQADAIDAVDLLVRAVLANSRGFGTVGQPDHERIAMIERALDKVGDDADRARLLSVLAVERIYEAELDERLAIVEEAITAARRSADPHALYLTLTHAGSRRGRRRRSHSASNGWTKPAQSPTDSVTPWHAIAPMRERMETALEAGDMVRVRDVRFGGPTCTGGHSVRCRALGNAFHAVWQTAVLGDLVEAERLAEAALQIGLQQRATRRVHDLRRPAPEHPVPPGSHGRDGAAARTGRGRHARAPGVSRGAGGRARTVR